MQWKHNILKWVQSRRKKIETKLTVQVACQVSRKNCILISSYEFFQYVFPKIKHTSQRCEPNYEKSTRLQLCQLHVAELILSP